MVDADMIYPDINGKIEPDWQYTISNILPKKKGVIKKKKSIQNKNNPNKLNSKRIKIYERDGYKCKFCGSDKDLTLDHIIPVSKGGNNKATNLQTLCKPCNMRKGAYLNKDLNRLGINYLEEPKIKKVKINKTKEGCLCDCHLQKGWDQSMYGVCCWKSNHRIGIEA